MGCMDTYRLLMLRTGRRGRAGRIATLSAPLCLLSHFLLPIVMLRDRGEVVVVHPGRGEAASQGNSRSERSGSGILGQ